MDYISIAAYACEPIAAAVGMGRIYFMGQHFNINFIHRFIYVDSSFQNTKSKKFVKERSVCGNMSIHFQLL